MTFVSYAFACFLFATLCLRTTLQSYPKLFKQLLLPLSLFFYAWHFPPYLSILLVSALVDFIAAKQIYESSAAKTRKTFLMLSLVTNLGLLAIFKYSNFLVDCAQDIAHLTGVQSDSSSINFEILLPIGISFYTFQSMSYSIDVYLKRLTPIDSFWKFLLYVSLFPQMVAGPIVRAKEFLYQIERKRRIRFKVWMEGLYLIIQGFFLKIVLADNIAITVNRVWKTVTRDHVELDLLSAWFLALAFSCQIFCDFAGYSRIARGIAYLLGFKLPKNFNAPYIAKSFQEFWRRWHITLSTWLKDYLYVPLGGNAGKVHRTARNLMIVMLLGGFWHGASYTFILWGAIHGLALAIERFGHLNKIKSLPITVVWALITQIVVLIAWVFFRAESVPEAFQIIQSMFMGEIRGLDPSIWKLAGVGCFAVFIVHFYSALKEKWYFKEPALAKAVMCGIMIYFLFTAYGYNANEFLYFQF